MLTFSLDITSSGICATEPTQSFLPCRTAFRALSHLPGALRAPCPILTLPGGFRFGTMRRRIPVLGATMRTERFRSSGIRRHGNPHNRSWAPPPGIRYSSPSCRFARHVAFLGASTGRNGWEPSGASSGRVREGSDRSRSACRSSPSGYGRCATRCRLIHPGYPRKTVGTKGGSAIREYPVFLSVSDSYARSSPEVRL